MVKQICNISIFLILAAIFTQPAWSAATPDNTNSKGSIWIAHNGYGAGDGTGNDGDGPGDGTGNGPGDCENSASFNRILMAKQNAGSGNNGGHGPGDGTGNDGDGPGDGTGYGPGDC